MDHGLFVAGPGVDQRTWRLELGLQQAFPDAVDVAVAEDTEAALDQPVPLAVPLAPLGRQKTDDRLSDSEPNTLHREPPIPATGFPATGFPATGFPAPGFPASGRPATGFPASGLRGLGPRLPRS